jgi:hypothetical protein
MYYKIVIVSTSKFPSTSEMILYDFKVLHSALIVCLDVFGGYCGIYSLPGHCLLAQARYSNCIMLKVFYLEFVYPSLTMPVSYGVMPVTKLYALSSMQRSLLRIISTCTQTSLALCFSMRGGNNLLFFFIKLSL